MLPGFVRRFLERRRFPTLMLIAAAVLIVNLFVPDPLPFVDEVLMLIATIVIGSFRESKRSGREAAS
jgi:uncharacterized membrane protein YccC